MDEDYNTNSVSAQEQIALKLLNIDRIVNGLPVLTMAPVLSEPARIKSGMRDNRHSVHESPACGSASAILKAFGCAFIAVGGSIARHANMGKAQAAFIIPDEAGNRRQRGRPGIRVRGLPSVRQHTLTAASPCLKAGGQC